MPFVDPEQSQAATAEIEAVYAAAAALPGAPGAAGRAFPLVKAYHEWFKAEVEGGHDPRAAVEGMARVLGGLAASTVLSCTGPAHVRPALDLMLLDIAQWAFTNLHPSAQTEVPIHRGQRQ